MMLHAIHPSLVTQMQVFDDSCDIPGLDGYIIIHVYSVYLALKCCMLLTLLLQHPQLKELYQELNNHTLRYMASLVFDLAAFLWKWALTLLVISNNWVSVGVAIGGGVVLPVLTFWQKAIHPTA